MHRAEPTNGSLLARTWTRRPRPGCYARDLVWSPVLPNGRRTAANQTGLPLCLFDTNLHVLGFQFARSEVDSIY